jgi:hypothetical protein
VSSPTPVRFAALRSGGFSDCGSLVAIFDTSDPQSWRGSQRGEQLPHRGQAKSDIHDLIYDEAITSEKTPSNGPLPEYFNLCLWQTGHNERRAWQEPSSPDCMNPYKPWHTDLNINFADPVARAGE